MIYHAVSLMEKQLPVWKNCKHNFGNSVWEQHGEHTGNMVYMRSKERNLWSLLDMKA